MAVSAQDVSTTHQFQPRRRMALVANAQAGALLGQANGTATLEDLLRAQAETLHIIAPTAGTLPERIAQAIATGADTIVIAGGDGTIACAAAALADTEQTLGLIPCGTMNLLARDLGLDPADHEAAIRTLATGTPRAIDAGCVTGADGAPHLFLCASMLGAPARLTRHRETGRRRGGGLRAWAGFARAALRALRANRSPRLTLRVNGQVLSRRTPSLTITMNPLADTAGRLFGRPTLDGGTLALYLVPRASVLRQTWLLLRTAITGTLQAPDIELITTKALDIDARGAAIRLLIDGEMRLLQPPLRYTIRPGAVRVMAPTQA